MRLQRMLSILLIIEAKGKVKAKDLAEKLETSVRTIYRDIDSICEAGIPLTTETGPSGGVSLMDGYKLDVKNMQMDEVKNLYLAAMGINPSMESNMNMKVNSALLKLQNNLSPKLNEELNKFTNKFLVDQNPWWRSKVTINFIDTLMQALWENIKLKIIYKKANGRTSDRIISPYGIVVKETSWYLIGFCELSNDIRTFKCERIIECELQNEYFKTDEKFNLEDYWHTSNDSFIKECKEREQYFVKVRFNKEYINRINNFEIKSLKEKDEHFEALINMYDHESAKKIIIGTIGYFEVLQPKELREFAVNELKNRLQKYDDID